MVAHELLGNSYLLNSWVMVAHESFSLVLPMNHLWLSNVFCVQYTWYLYIWNNVHMTISDL